MRRLEFPIKRKSRKNKAHLGNTGIVCFLPRTTSFHLHKSLEVITMGFYCWVDSGEMCRCITRLRSYSLLFTPPFLLSESPIWNAPLPPNHYLAVYNHTIVWRDNHNEGHWGNRSLHSGHLSYTKMMEGSVAFVTKYPLNNYSQLMIC